LNEPDYADYARGMVSYSKKDYDAALPLLLKAAQALPDFPPAHDGLGLTYEALGDLQNAKASYEASVKLDPNDFTASTGLQRVDALLKK
jgi:tetratricopeptide (TPR) repeat protein